MSGTTDAKHWSKELMKFPPERGGRWKIQQRKIELGSLRFREAKVKEMQQSSAVFSLKINTVLLINVLILLCRRQVRFFNMQATLKERECSLCQY